MQPEIPREVVWNSASRAIAPRAGFEGRAFHLRFVPFALAQGLSGVIPVTFFAIHGPPHLRLLVLGLMGLKMSLGSILSAAIVSRFFPIIINEQTLRARNFFGLAREVDYDEIARVKPIRWFFVAPFLRISTVKKHNIIWLPLFLAEQTEFEDSINRYAPSDNPLRLFLESRASKR